MDSLTSNATIALPGTVKLPGGRSILVIGFILFAGLVAMSIYTTFETVTFDEISGRYVGTVDYAETDTFSPTDIMPDSIREDVRLPFGVCCKHKYAVFSSPINTQDRSLKDPAILVDHARDNFAVYIDDKWVFGVGRLESPPDKYGHNPRLIRLPPDRVASGGTINFVVSRAQGRKLITPFLIGEHAELQKPFNRLHTSRVVFPRMHVTISFLVAFFCMAAASLFSNRSVLYSTAVLMMFWGGVTLIQLVTAASLSAIAYNLIFFSMFWGTLISAVYFLIEWTSVFPAPRAKGYLGRLAQPVSLQNRQRLLKACILIFVLAMIYTTFHVMTGEGRGATKANKLITWTALLIMPVLGVRIIAYYSQNNRDAIVEGAAFLFIISAFIADMVAVRFFDKPGNFTFAASLFFPLALMLSLARRAQTVFDSAMLNTQTMAKRVAESEARILENQQELRRRDREAALLEERGRIMRDSMTASVASWSLFSHSPAQTRSKKMSWKKNSRKR